MYIVLRVWYSQMVVVLNSQFGTRFRINLKVITNATWQYREVIPKIPRAARIWRNEGRFLGKQVNERMMTNNQPTTRKSVHKSWYGIAKHRRLTFNLYIWLLLGVQLMVNKLKLYLQDISNPSVRQKHRHHCHASRSRSPAIDGRLCKASSAKACTESTICTPS